MKKIYILLITIFVVTGCQPDELVDNAVYDIPKEIDVTYSKGNANAAVTITEYSDYQCPFCAKFTLDTLPLLQNDYLETGKVLFQFKDYPIPNHEYAFKAAEATYCAGDQNEDAFWEMHIKLFENQDNLTTNDLMNYAEELGLETNSFNNCLDVNKYKNLVLRNRQEGIELNVTATPTLVINDEIVAGLQPYENLVKIIETQLKK
ncbi:DsbA family protein [Patescibacteria group bacterium]